jgi:asparagine synthase (glutamine-hydrolysing)
MCGLAGFLQPRGLSPDSGELVARLADTLTHRGPDASGTWMDAVAGIALGHRRLTVLELSEAGHQPMLGASGRHVIAFNGEIYNHLALRASLEASQRALIWRGHSDTETLLSCIEHWGLEATLTRTLGMFAFALWDQQTRTLFLARDRAGEKPLFYGWQGGVFLFGSELKALRTHPAFSAEIDRDALALYMQYGYISAPHSIYRNIYKLPPGSYLRLAAPGVPGSLPQPAAYWSLREVAENARVRPFAGTDVEAVEALGEALKQAVVLQSVADVPLGAFLSGGIDSSTVVALMQSQATRPIKTFTVGFHESDFQEAQYARSVAELLGTEHHELYVTHQEAQQVIPQLPVLYDEPFGDSSAIPTAVLAQFARKHVTVALSGDGGDELFGGYTRYQRTDDMWRVMRRLPQGARRVLSRGCRAYSRRYRTTAMGWKASRLAQYLSARTVEECYLARILHCQDVDELVLRATCRATGGFAAAVLPRLVRAGGVYETMMYADAMTYLPDDILTKVDRASMGFSLEARVPMLDHRVIEFAWGLPQRLKVRNGRGKWLLRRLLAQYLPVALIERPKMGFGVPVGEWLRGPLRAWAEDLLDERALQSQGFLNPRRVREQWHRHLNRSSHEADSLWQVLMFQAWLASGSGPDRAQLS